MASSKAPLPTLRPENRLLDCFMVNDELDMMRYRLRLHGQVTWKFLIVESSVTFTGHPKPLHAKNALTPEEIRRYNIQLIDVMPRHDRMAGVRTAAAQQGNFTVSKTGAKGDAMGARSFAMEHNQRRIMSRMLRNEIATLSKELHGQDFLVYVRSACLHGRRVELQA